MARWAVIAGEDGEQSASLALELVAELRAASVRVGGFVQRKGVDGDGKKGYDFVRLRDEETVPLALEGASARGPGEETFCSLVFQQAGFDAARRWLEEDAATADLLVLDGISKLEVSGRGHAAALEAALQLPDKVVLLCVRGSQLVYAVERFKLAELDVIGELEWPAEPTARDAFARELREACGR